MGILVSWRVHRATLLWEKVLSLRTKPYKTQEWKLIIITNFTHPPSLLKFQQWGMWLISTNSCSEFQTMQQNNRKPCFDISDWDCVWHLHLQYTENYKNTVNKICLTYHFPSKGGNFEFKKYSNFNEHTLKLLEEYFGISTADIWSLMRGSGSLTPG